MRLLFILTETLTIPGRGIVLLPELKPVDDERFRVGDPLLIRHPDGTDEAVGIGGLELLKPLNGNCELVVTLSGKSKQDVPIGSEVWSVDKPESW